MESEMSDDTDTGKWDEWLHSHWRLGWVTTQPLESGMSDYTDTGKWDEWQHIHWKVGLVTTHTLESGISDDTDTQSNIWRHSMQGNMAKGVWEPVTGATLVNCYQRQR
jgi:hypothetical protein